VESLLVDIPVQITPDIYKSYVTTYKKEMKQLLVQCQNALYGTMVASLLYYCKFTKGLTSVRFKINPYDPCIANKTVDGMQMTICFHVDAKWVGMTLDYTIHGWVNISMFNYIDKIIDAFDKAEPKWGGTKSSAAPDNLFKVDKECEKLLPEKAVEFHNLVAKTLYMPENEPDLILALLLHF
jgi:hypothetical protein